jgi:hypothetical protein
MNQRRITLAVVALMLPALAMTPLGRTTVHLVLFWDGYVQEATYTYDNDNGDSDEYWVCPPGSMYCTRFCGVCHINGEDKSKEKYTVERHKQSYFPRFATTLSEGQKLSWNQSGGYLTSEGGSLKAYFKEGVLGMVAPTGSQLLKDRSGTPFLLRMPTKPSLLAPTR